MAGGEKIIDGLLEAVQHARGDMSERTMRERCVELLAARMCPGVHGDIGLFRSLGEGKRVYWVREAARAFDAILAEMREPDATTTEILAVYLGANERDEQALACARSGWRTAFDVIREER